ncbi:hypothetical protein QR680_005310 [Steinernema hermaphroditum]|uniref:Fanconi-associated nuclease n=1 Tax=Steinernema hermaphroditum TaxID=289476 RepID=A0AA39LVE9_9BILA|nr:hypothetical protein QR680_005310 [Steinernema hermaphroditum]
MLARAFARQVAGKLCLICRKRVSHDSFQRHLNLCRVPEDDEECQVLVHLTAEDKRRQARENFVDLANCSPPLAPKQEDLCEPSTSAVNENTPTIPKVHPTPASQKARERKRPRKLDHASPTSHKEKIRVRTSSQKIQRTSKARNTKSRETSNVHAEANLDVNLNEASQSSDLETTHNRRRRSTRLSKVSAQSNADGVSEPRDAEVEPIPIKRERRSVESQVQRSAKRSIFPTGDVATLVKVETIIAEERVMCSLDEAHQQIVEALQKKADFYHSPTTSPQKKVLENNASNGVVTDLTTLGDSPSQQSPSYQLRFILRILHKVFCYFFRDTARATDFWSENLHQIAHFLHLSQNSQTLLTRLVLRKRRWLAVSRLNSKYTEIADDLTPLFKELTHCGLTESISPDNVSLTEALNLLQAHDIQGLCKNFKVDHRNGRLDLIKALLKKAKQKNVFGKDVESAILKKVVQNMGPTFRLRQETTRLFSAILTLYAPVQMDTVACWDDATLVLPQQLIFTMLNVQTKKAVYPAPLPCSSSAILSVFNGYPSLEDYVKAKENEQEMALSFSNGDYSSCISASDAAYGELQYRLNVDTDNNMISKHSSYPHCLRKYTDTWLLIRMVSHGIEALQRVKEYPRAVEMLEFLLTTEALIPFCPDSRGAWWDRLALNSDAHLKDKRKALLICQLGLKDDHVALKEKLLLQDRASKLDKKGEFPLVINVSEPKKVTINGVVLGKNLGDQRMNHFMLLDEDGVHRNHSVEDVALNHYLTTLGYMNGVHAEGSIWHTLFGLMFYDIIFDHSVEVAWLSELQDHPTDLNTRDFYHNRKSAFDSALLKLEISKDYSQWLPRMRTLFEEKHEEVNSEISWGIFSSFEQVKHFLDCCKPEMLAKIFKKFATDNRNNRSGFPDLTVWNAAKKSLAVVEVKGPNDRLSTKQRLWLDFFHANDVEAVVCHVVATTCRNLS